MSREPIYATNASLNIKEDKKESNSSSIEISVIRPPIRKAYDTQEEYERSKLQGIMFAQENNITYIDHY
jgi:hypothetical protein